MTALRRRVQAVAGLLAVAALLLATPAAAAGPAPPGPGENARWLPQSGLEEANAILIASKQAEQALLLNADAEALACKSELDRTMRALADSSIDAAQRRRLERERADREHALVEQLSRRDAEFARLAASIRSSVAPIAADPRRAPYLALYRDGKLDAALAGLDELAAIDDRARRAGYDRRATIEQAGELRQIADLAILSVDTGDMPIDKVIRRYTALVTLDATSDDWQRIARLELRRMRLDAALDAARKALTLAADADSRLLALSVLRDIHAARGRRSEELAVLEQRVSLTSERAAAAPRNAAARRAAFAALLDLARFSGEESDLDGAGAMISKALAAAGEALVDAPADDLQRRSRVADLIDLGLALEAVYGGRNGVRQFDQALAIARPLAQQHPQDADITLLIARALAGTGRRFAVTGATDEAIERLEKAADELRRLRTRDAVDARVRRELAQVLSDLANAADPQREPLAIAANRESLSLWNGFAANGDVAARIRLTDVQTHLANLLKRQSQKAEAETLLNAALASTERLAATAPMSADAQRQLLRLHVELFLLYRDQDRLDASEAQRRAADATLAYIDRNALHLPTSKRNAWLFVREATGGAAPAAGGRVMRDGSAIVSGSYGGGDGDRALTPAEFEDRVTQSIRRAPPPSTSTPRFALLDIAVPVSVEEYDALDGYGVLLVSALSHDATELPLARAYARLGDREFVLTPLHATPVRRVDGGWQRADRFYLFPIFLQSEGAELLLDFARGREGMTIARFQGQSSRHLRSLPTRRPLHVHPPDAALARFFSLSLPGFPMPPRAPRQ